MLVFASSLQEVSIPPKFCDDRVAVLQADARLLTPEVLQAYTTDVSGGLLVDANFIDHSLLAIPISIRTCCRHTPQT
jgi:hypothetical protein